jgi:hypothetical protein
MITIIAETYTIDHIRLVSRDIPAEDSVLCQITFSASSSGTPPAGSLLSKPKRNIITVRIRVATARTPLAQPI